MSGWGSLRADYAGLHFVLSPDASDIELGDAVLLALSKSRFVHPDSDPELFDNIRVAERYNTWITDLMNAFGYRTKTNMFKGMKSPDVEVRNGQITIIPTKRERGEGFGPTLRGEKDHVHLPANSSPEEVGAAIRLGLERCIG